MERKLAAIVAGDVVGYSRSMEADEAGTYAALQSAFCDIIQPSLDRHGGRNFKNTGDGFLATFPSVNDALDAAIEIQAGFAEHPLSLRIGVNLGDVIETDGDTFGDGVNVAARLQAMAEPGSIYVSAAVVRSADRNRADAFRRVGRRRAKNIADPIEVYRVNPGSASSIAAWLPSMRIRQPAGVYLGVAAVVGLVAAGLADRAGLAAFASSTIDTVMRISGTAREQRPAIAVLPFDDMGEAANDQYFVDGLTEDVIAELARYADLQVIARNSTFAMRGQAADVRELGRRLGADYIVEGSARRAGDQLRVVAQLVETKTGAHLWSSSYDRRVDDVFLLQADLAAEIVSHVGSYVRQSEVAAAAQRPTDSLQAYDLVLRARSQYKHGSSDGDGLLASRALLLRALELDPGYAAARAGLGLTYIVDAVNGLTGRASAPEIETGLSEARQAIQLDPNLAAAYQVLSFGLAAKGEYQEAMQAGLRAVDLNPNDPDSLMALAKAQVRFDRYGEAVENAERARRLQPLAPQYYVYVHGQALYAAGQTEEAEAVLGECLMTSPDEADCLLIWSALLAELGRRDEARAAMDRLRAVRPEFSLESERQYRRFGDSPLMERFLAALALAQAPEAADRAPGAAAAKAS
ncbi:MAG: adenylate/guanylate cyclase domain-containing protein [Aurantimonas endophytica]|uniref:adenylate/guanylate cyclase domain-containing protein n=1 Tax=Aurantimonas endophytica TaxID=1522175 RepID=UPI00300109DA